MIAGTEGIYKTLTKFPTGKPEEYGRWTQTIGTDQFKGSLDIYKYFQVNFLDNRILLRRKMWPWVSVIFSRYMPL